MPSLSSSDVLGAVERRIHDVAGAPSPAIQAIVLSEPVMWLWMLGETFTAGASSSAMIERGSLGSSSHGTRGLPEAMALSGTSSKYSDHYTEMYEALSGRSYRRHGVPQRISPRKRTYTRLLEDRLVLDTLVPLVAALRATGL